MKSKIHLNAAYLDKKTASFALPVKMQGCFTLIWGRDLFYYSLLNRKTPLKQRKKLTSFGLTDVKGYYHLISVLINLKAISW